MEQEDKTSQLTGLFRSLLSYLSPLSFLKKYIPTPSSVKNQYQEIRKSYSQLKQLIWPYVTSRENFTEASLVFLTNIVLPTTTGVLTHYFNNNHNNSEDERQQNTNITESLTDPATMVLIVVPIANMALRSAVNYLLRRSLKDKIRQDILKRYLSPEHMELTDFSDKMKGVSSTPQVIFNYTDCFVNSTIPLTIGLLGNVLSFGAMFYSSNKLVGFKVASITFGLSVGTGIAIAKARSKFIEIYKRGWEIDGDIIKRLNYIESRKSQINALKGSDFELLKICEGIKEQQKSKFSIASTTFIENGMIGFVYACSPGILRNMSTIYPIGTTQKAIDVFSSFFIQGLSEVRSITSNTTENRTYFQKSMDNISNLQQAISDVDDFLRNRQLQIEYENSNGKIEIKNFNLGKPEKKEEQKEEEKSESEKIEEEDIFLSLCEKVACALNEEELLIIKSQNLTLNPGETYQLIGESGLGKSILLKTLQGLWPYASGQITFPCKKEEIYYIPQETFTTYKSSFLENIIYPRRIESLNDRERKEVEILMRTLKLEDKISDLEDEETQKDWSFLSPGEKQRISVIRMLFNQVKPRIILMDEITSSVDSQNKKIMLELIKERLPMATIIFVDHGNNEQLENKQESQSILDCDYIIEIGKHDKTLIVSERGRTEKIIPNPIKVQTIISQKPTPTALTKIKME
jgi:ABC-type uncharacterized transport system fused permease/ATPase subunit